MVAHEYSFSISGHYLDTWPQSPQSGSALPQVSTANGMTSRPMPKAIAVNATGLPSVPIRLTNAPTPKLTPAAMNRPNEVVNAKAVARIVVPYCSGNQRLKIAKLPPKKPKKNSSVVNGCSPLGK